MGFPVESYPPTPVYIDPVISSYEQKHYIIHPAFRTSELHPAFPERPLQDVSKAVNLSLEFLVFLLAAATSLLRH